MQLYKLRLFGAVSPAHHSINTRLYYVFTAGFTSAKAPLKNWKFVKSSNNLVPHLHLLLSREVRKLTLSLACLMHAVLIIRAIILLSHLKVIDRNLYNYVWRLLKGTGKRKDLIEKFSLPEEQRINIVRGLFAVHKTVIDRAERAGILGSELCERVLSVNNMFCINI